MPDRDPDGSTQPPSRKGRLLTVSNRLPVTLRRNEQGEWKVEPGSGGLVTALVPVLRDRGGVWIGWSGIVEEEAGDVSETVGRAGDQAGYRLSPVTLTAEERDKFYFGFSNEIIWPMFHDLHTLCNFDPAYWRVYQQVNRKFAGVIVEHHQPGDYVWVHDYHLMSVARLLREMGKDFRVGFFLHIPFPPLDLFLILPWRLEILRGLLDYDFLGFQTRRDQRNFLSCVQAIVPEAVLKEEGRLSTIQLGSREMRVGYFPISIDFEDFARRASGKEVAEAAWYIHEHLPNRKLILGVDRLDYTKGIPYRLNAFREALVRHPELQEKISFIQVVVPSREDIPQYHRLKEEIERLVGEINGQFTRAGWVPVHYIFRRLESTELLAYYRTAEIALITPLKDGMNLVCKEYCACNLEENGVLILSEFAGAADQLQDGALLVNPVDLQGVAGALYRAFVMEEQERRSRMQRLRKVIQEQDIFWWVDSFLRASIYKVLQDFPVLKEYVPRIHLEGEGGSRS